MKTNTIIYTLIFSAGYLCAQSTDSNIKYTQQEDSPSNIQNLSTAESFEHNKKKSVRLDTSIVTTIEEQETYQSGTNLNAQILRATPSGNGDIGSVLKIIPNVQFDNAQLKSNTPGEIDPANIAISGGLFYQNNFQLDGFNINNDLDPIGGTSNGPNALKGGRSQGLAVDTSLLDSIQVQDSNISAAYGGFTGGVIGANVRKPRHDKGGLYGWHGSMSYQFTSSTLTQYFIEASQEQNFITSSNENFQPNFTKHLVRANLEGYVSANLGVIASFSTTRSLIPLKAYSFDTGTQANSTRNQHRIIDNYYIKTNYNPNEHFTLEASLAYMPQDNTYYNSVAKDSFYSMKSGGIQSGIKAIYDNNFGLWTNTLSYSWLQNSRQSEKNYFMSWRYAAGDKDWASSSSKSTASEGGYGDMEQIQKTLSYKSDMSFESLEWWKSTHEFRLGFETSYTYALRNRLNSYYAFATPKNLNGAICGSDSKFNFATCSNATTGNNWQGQYFNSVTESKPGEITLGNFAYGLYGEDSIFFNLNQFGTINTRLGLRLDNDSYMQKYTLAPRFSFNYTLPWHTLKDTNIQSTLIFGANRYYGRNLLSYQLYELVSNNTTTFTRPDANSPWTESTSKDGNANYDFRQLNVPYADELVAGFSQNIGIFVVVGKYIYRNGQDEVMQKSEKNGTSTLNTWSNDGKSQSHVLTLSIQNLQSLEVLGVKNSILLAFDWTQTKRSYNLYAADDAYLENNDIIYDGHFIKYQDRPVSNFARPFTLRLSTTHSIKLWRTKWILNNFLRYRAGYESMVLIGKNQPNYNPAYPNMNQYGKMYFNGAFTWDMRVGIEMRTWKNSLVFVNIDIFNVLNAKNMSTLSGTNGSIAVGIPSSTSVAVYEVGRQFWLQGGFRF